MVRFVRLVDLNFEKQFSKFSGPKSVASFRPHFKVYITCQGFRNGPLSGPSFRDHENYFFVVFARCPDKQDPEVKVGQSI